MFSTNTVESSLLRSVDTGVLTFDTGVLLLSTSDESSGVLTSEDSSSMRLKLSILPSAEPRPSFQLSMMVESVVVVVVEDGDRDEEGGEAGKMVVVVVGDDDDVV